MFSQFRFTQIDVQVFLADYAQARLAWLRAVDSLACRHAHLAFPCAGEGPRGEALFTDSVWLGAADAKNVLVVIGGTHGIEGFAGSAVQLDLLRWLASEKPALPPHTAILLIHALTPWGYAWLRRCDAEGVDLNRNAVDFTQPLPDNANYTLLKPALFAADLAQRQALFAEFTAQFGRIALEKAISGGQYRDAQGPFYGGAAPAHGRLVCESLMQRYALPERRLAVIDVHTGLGSYGYGEIICDHDPASAGAAVAANWYGDSVTLPLAGTSSSVPKLGLMDYAWHAIMDQQSCFVTLEFGTFSTDHLFEILLRDHQLWAQAENWPDRLAHSQIMRRHFCPAEAAWQEMLLFRGRQVINQAWRGLSL
jgi:hypothetical protein